MIKNLSILILLVISVNIFAQKTNSSPYSVLGIGDGISSKTVEESSMGGVGIANNNPNDMNFSNPASFASLFLTTYTMAGENRGFKIKEENEQVKASNAYLSYIAIGIPLGEKGGFAFGLKPNTTVGYTLANNTSDSEGDVVESSIYEGDGGTNKVFLGLGYEVFKNVSIGLEGSYVFGNINNKITNIKKDITLGTEYNIDNKINGAGLKAGIIYENKLKENLFLNLGTTLEFENELESEGNEYFYSVSLTDGIPRDTLLNSASRGTYKTPLKTSLGVSISDPNKWAASIDYSFQNPIELGGSLINKNPRLNYSKASVLAIGGFYLPKYNSISSYWDRVVYRAGMRIEKTGLMVDGTGDGANFTSIDDFGISFGVGLPLGNQVSRLNLGFEFGKRGTTDNGLVEEEYFNFRLGLTLSNKWFRKREIN
ncbi:MAG: hypothetical protein ACI87F_000278 [Candidatus Azotimanducaceae bacterium]|jgi:hypothetical protein